ncbi:isochorismatase family protein [Mesorhizobium sp. J428]|uniref:isochorismatase family protein n=1 Tax=Mesorhizobium sp. J428 TaxID=2898440 RepID=UPI002150904C|nr:isochorismatase family protein [Mesorhizobium sp. J428]MCR5856435.1 isochorismatase family protein [Mesorhizobium sp. J428]
MLTSDKTTKEIFKDHQRAPKLPNFGMGKRVALLNVDLQRRYTDTATFASAYEADPEQLPLVNELSRTVRRLGMPVIWTFVAYLPGGADCGWWGVRSQSPMALQNVGHDSPQAEIDARLDVDRVHDLMLHKRMGSAFFETHLPSYLTFNRIDTVIVTGGATSGCVRATVVDAMSHGYRVIVPEECVADREDWAHYASLYDIAVKYGDVVPARKLLADLAQLASAETSDAA